MMLRLAGAGRRAARHAAARPTLAFAAAPSAFAATAVAAAPLRSSAAMAWSMTRGTAGASVSFPSAGPVRSLSLSHLRAAASPSPADQKGASEKKWTVTHSSSSSSTSPPSASSNDMPPVTFILFEKYGAPDFNRSTVYMFLGVIAANIALLIYMVTGGPDEDPLMSLARDLVRTDPRLVTILQSGSVAAADTSLEPGARLFREEALVNSFKQFDQIDSNAPVTEAAPSPLPDGRPRRWALDGKPNDVEVWAELGVAPPSSVSGVSQALGPGQMRVRARRVEPDDTRVNPRTQTPDGHFIVKRKQPALLQAAPDLDLAASEGEGSSGSSSSSSSPSAAARALLAKCSSELELLSLELIFPRAKGGARAFVFDPSTGTFTERFGMTSLPRLHRTGPGSSAAKSYGARRDPVVVAWEWVARQSGMAYVLFGLTIAFAGMGLLKKRQMDPLQPAWARRVLRSLRDHPDTRELWQLRNFDNKSTPPGNGPTGVRNGVIEIRRQYADFVDDSLTRMQHEYLIRSPLKEGYIRMNAERDPAPAPFNGFFGKWTITLVEMEVEGRKEHMRQKKQ